MIAMLAASMLIAILNWRLKHHQTAPQKQQMAEQRPMSK
jgi:hypothetical protein